MIVPRYYENLNVLHENTMPARAYYIPASKRMDNLVAHRELSDRIQFLNGTWKFQYYPSIYDVKENFFALGCDVSSFAELPVPGVWQNAGYDTHQYTNIRYPFPFDPPFVPQDNPCGAYVYDFVYTEDENTGRTFLNFEGVDSCFYVWLNGNYVGYSQVSHVTSEFDVSPYIQEGKNTIAVLVLKWCDGSYLEDQDKFRTSGIFRDVYLLKRPERAVRDYHVTTELLEKSAIVNVQVAFGEPIETKVTIEDSNGAVVGTDKMREDGTIAMELANPILWNTEQPYLYTLILETAYETIVDHIGIRKIEIVDRAIYLNGQKIKFRGVNRHDSDPVTGPTIGIDQVMTDLVMMKQHNFNAIRSSHYPNAPYFYQLCDRYGFMVIDEADIEAHGPFLLYRKEDTDYNRFKRWNEQPADDPAWEQAILDRVQLMVQRDKNRPSIVMWSMGNESAYGCNFEKALQWTKEFDPSRLTQYESARYRNYDNTYHYEHLDLYSRMYPSLAEMETYMKEDASKPFLLVEYCHSMGNGPGDFEDYFQMIHKYDQMCGGFVWEWCDHAIDKGFADNGKKMYFYGGNHGECVHDGNFCMDGLVYPDRRPHTGLLEYKNVYRPARVVAYDQNTGEMMLHNYMDFDDLQDYVYVRYELTCDGISIASGRVELPSIAPHQDGRVQLKLTIPERGKVYLKLIYLLKKNVPLIPECHILGFDELFLENTDARNQHAVELLTKNVTPCELDVLEEDAHVVVTGNAFSYTYSKKNGMFTSMQFGGREYLNHPIELNIWRAPTDNDMYIKHEWKKAHYDEAYVRAYDTEVVVSEKGVKVIAQVGVVAPTVQRILDATIAWEIDCEGALTSKIHVVKNEEMPDLPRFGLRIFLPKQFDNISYFGMGPQESYRDKHQAAHHGFYRATVSELHEDYIMPQENGSHYDCDFVELSDETFRLTAAAWQTFSFNASVYTQEELERAMHNYELQPSDSTVLCLDYAQNGIGSNSCGPVVLDAYRLDDLQFTFEIKLIPYVKK